MLLATLTLLAPLAAIPASDPLPMPPPPPGMTLRSNGSDAASPANAELPMPPPPQGMKRLSPKQQTALANGEPIPVEDSGGAEPLAPLNEESAELEELRALEEVAFESPAGDSGVLLHSVMKLGPAHPLRMRLEDVLIDSDHREDAFAELAPVTDLLSFDVSLVEDRYDIPVEMQPLVAHYIRFFQGPGRKWFRKWMARSTRYIPVMQPILEKKGLPRDTVYLAMIESGFSTQAYSWAHAAGPWQFISATGKYYGLEQNFWVDERRDPIKATHAAAEYLSDLHAQLGHWYLAWAGYNTGGGRVKRLCMRRNTTDFWTISEGKGLATETKHYVPKLIAAALVAKNPQAFGFSEDEFDYQPPLEFDEVKIPDLTDLSVIAKAAGVTEAEIRDLNPELMRWCTPPATEENPYILRLPKGRAAQFAENFAKIPKGERMRYVEHKIKRGDTLSKIAQRHGASAEAIMRFNDLKSARALKVNTTLMIPVPIGSKAKVAEALKREAVAARKGGYVHRAEEEIPAGTPTVASGSVKTEVIGGRTRISYGVQSGDTLWGICQRFSCSVDNLRKWNDLPRRGRRLKVGTVLAIWQDGTKTAALNTAPARATAPASSHARVHELASGETLWSVAQQYGVSVDQLKSWNGISDHRKVKVGQKLRIGSP